MYTYTPTTLDAFDIPHKEILQPFTNTLLLGHEQTGKTTLANILARRAQPLKDRVMYIHSLNDKGIQYYRTEVKYFCQTTFLHKIIVVDGLDNMNDQTQQIFLNYMNRFRHTTSFIITGSNPQKIIEGLYSQCIIVHMNPASDAYIKSLMDRVVEQEHINITHDAMLHLMYITKNSIRSILNYLEKYKIINLPITKAYIQHTYTISP